MRLVVKPHPHSDQSVIDERLPAHPAVQVLREGEIDINLLLHEADALVTDYSSAVYDYAIRERPILFFAPDVDDYDQQGRGLYEPYASLTGGSFHRTWASLLEAVVESVTGGADSEGHATVRHIRAMARNSEAPGSSERIVQAIRGALGSHRRTLAPCAYGRRSGSCARATSRSSTKSISVQGRPRSSRGGQPEPRSMAWLSAASK